MGKITDIMKQLSEAYKISEKDVIPIVESAIKHSIFSYYGKDADVYYNGDEYEIITYNNESMPIKLDLNKTSKKFIAFLKKHLTNRLLIEKVLSDYKSIRHLQGDLVDGYVLENVNDYYSIKLNNMPSDVKGILLLRHRIPNEQLRFNEFYFFLASKIGIVKSSYGLDLVVYLSRISKRLPALLLQKAVAEKTGVNIDCECIKRVVGKFSVLKTKIDIPKDFVLFVQENLNGERIIIRRS